MKNVSWKFQGTLNVNGILWKSIRNIRNMSRNVRAKLVEIMENCREAFFSRSYMIFIWGMAGGNRGNGSSLTFIDLNTRRITVRLPPIPHRTHKKSSGWKNHIWPIARNACEFSFVFLPGDEFIWRRGWRGLAGSSKAIILSVICLSVCIFVSFQSPVLHVSRLERSVHRHYYYWLHWFSPSDESHRRKNIYNIHLFVHWTRTHDQFNKHVLFNKPNTVSARFLFIIIRFFRCTIDLMHEIPSRPIINLFFCSTTQFSIWLTEQTNVSNK